MMTDVIQWLMVPLAIGRKGFSDVINSCLMSLLSFSVLLRYHFKARTGHKGFSELALSLAKLWKDMGFGEKERV